MTRSAILKFFMNKEKRIEFNFTLPEHFLNEMHFVAFPDLPWYLRQKGFWHPPMKCFDESCHHRKRAKLSKNETLYSVEQLSMDFGRNKIFKKRVKKGSGAA